jgi:hypothetical protein
MSDLIKAVEEAIIILDADPHPYTREAVRKLRSALAEVLQEEVREYGT